MKKSEMISFLKREGWPKDPHTDGRFIDPRTAGKDGREVSYSLAFGYVTASRRKRQRETRKLKKAGWAASGDYRGKWYLLAPALIHGADYKTRQEALQTLEAQP